MIHPETHKIFTEFLRPEMRVIEFGNNGVNINEKTQARPHPNGTGGVLGTVSNQYYRQNYGAEMVSIDINGLNGSLKIDLSKAVKDESLLESADIVTDFGTAEHIKNLYQAFRNAFNFGKVGGLLIHANPKTGSFKDHGFHWFDVEFWKRFASAAKLEVVRIGTHQVYGPRYDNDGWEVFAVLRKTEKSKFPTKKAFETLQEKYVFAK